MNFSNTQQLPVESSQLREVADHLGTPFYCYSQARLEANINACKHAFEALSIDIHFAMKANSNLTLLRLIAAQGLGVDLVSQGEMMRAQAAGFSVQKMIFSGVGKSVAELQYALQAGVGQINVESREELEVLADLTLQLEIPIKVALRVNPDVSVDTHENITTGSKGNKFGVDFEQTVELFQRYSNHPWLNLDGLAMHIGSQICDIRPYRQAISRLMELVSQLQDCQLKVNSLDLGGGYGIDYGDGQQLTFAAVAEAIEEETVDFNGKVCIEPGRSLIADAGVLVSQVNYVKQASPRPFLILDVAMNDFMRPALYQAEHPLLALDMLGHSDHCPYDVVGPICESTDTFARNCVLPEGLQAGDLMVFLCAGAYGAVMSNTYNSRDLIPEVLLSESGTKIIRQRVTQQQFMDFENVSMIS